MLEHRGGGIIPHQDHRRRGLAGPLFGGASRQRWWCGLRGGARSPTLAVAYTIDGTAYTVAAGYDANGRLATVTYPLGFAVKHVYNARGHQTELRDSATDALYWQANTRDAEGRLTQFAHGNGIVTSRGFDAGTGRLLSVAAGPGNTVQNNTYQWDLLGNLAQRTDAVQSLTEAFSYDGLNRVTQTTVGVKALYIEPGSPWENGDCESFNGKLGDELLKIEIFYTLLEAQVPIERWRREDNTNRPHSALGYRPPAPVTLVPGTADPACAIEGLRPDRPFPTNPPGLT